VENPVEVPGADRCETFVAQQARFLIHLTVLDPERGEFTHHPAQQQVGESGVAGECRTVQVGADHL
jgi:hypothetical protein